MQDKYTGVETVPVAGEQEAEEVGVASFDFDSQETAEPLDAGEDAGVEESAAAGQEKSEDRVEKAFAKRLAQEREKIKRELEEELSQRFAGLQASQVQQPQVPLEERAKQLADELMITPEAAKALLTHEQRLQDVATQLYLMRDQAEKLQAQQDVEQKRKANPYLPPFDERKIATYRLRHYQRYGVMPSWSDAYDAYVAEATKSGELLRLAEQQAVQQIAGRNRATTQIGKAAAPAKPSVWDMSKEEFDQLVARAKAGELKKS